MSIRLFSSSSWMSLFSAGRTLCWVTPMAISGFLLPLIPGTQSLYQEDPSRTACTTEGSHVKARLPPSHIKAPLKVLSMLFVFDLPIQDVPCFACAAYCPCSVLLVFCYLLCQLPVLWIVCDRITTLCADRNVKFDCFGIFVVPCVTCSVVHATLADYISSMRCHLCWTLAALFFTCAESARSCQCSRRHSWAVKAVSSSA